MRKGVASVNRSWEFLANERLQIYVNLLLILACNFLEQSMCKDSGPLKNNNLPSHDDLSSDIYTAFPSSLFQFFLHLIRLHPRHRGSLSQSFTFFSPTTASHCISLWRLYLRRHPRHLATSNLSISVLHQFSFQQQPPTPAASHCISLW
ncbi:hypothetical protein F0562_008958 [Nyssa sinensis]|uniref:Uncharacterized protein n=1 Tax=Nyssa sinensis TaxID=561372 RepID=A0A5J5A7E2_9ASTE|nr:hypothetical protein F0562_008958 [Nyssa sinensis]